MKSQEIESRLNSIGNKRPVLIFTPDRLERLRSRLSGSSSERAKWERLRQRGRVLLRLPWPEEAPSSSVHHQEFTYRMPADHLGEVVRTLGLLHLLEPDERYAGKIREGLLHYADDYPPYKTWCSPHFSRRKPAWRSELITTHLCFSYIAGHEILGDWLSDEDRKRIAETLLDRGVIPLLQDWLLPDTRIHCLDTMGHNWWVVCLSMAGIGALAMLGRHPAAASWAASVERSMPLWFGYGGSMLQNRAANFDTAGGYLEGVHYADYALGDYLLYRTALLDVIPDYSPPDKRALQAAAQFLVHTLYPSTHGCLVVNFGDTKAQAAATTAMRLLASNNIAAELGSWYVARTGSGEPNPMALLFGDDLRIAPPKDLPNSAFFPGAGWAAMRSGWEDDATLLAMRSGIYWIHAHADSGSFILFHRGQPLIVDAGHCEYYHQEYTDYYASSRAHNVVLINGRGAPPEDFLRGSKFPGRLHSLLDNGGMKYVCADAAGPLAHLVKRNYRHLIWTEGAIVIVDDLLAHEAAQFSWLLHYAGTAEWDSQGTQIRNGEAGASVQILHPRNLDARAVECPHQDTLEARSSYLEFSTRNPERQQIFLTIIVPLPAPGASAPRVERIESPGLPGVRIIGSDLTTEVYLNPEADGRDTCRNPLTSLGGWETDACLLAISSATGSDANNPITPGRALMVDGSTLRREGITLLDSISRIDGIFSFEPDRVSMEIQGQKEIDLRIHSAACPREVIINGKSGEFDFNSVGQALRCWISLP